MIKTYKKQIIMTWMILVVYLLIFSQGYLKGLDQYTYQFLSSWQSSSMNQIMITITYLGSAISIIGICLFCIFINWRKGLYISTNVGVIVIINQIIKMIVARSRPSVLHLVVETGYSFPSAHAMVSMTLFGLIAYFLWNKNKVVSILLITLSFMIGITRIYVGVHYTSDVIAGFLFAFTYLTTTLSILKYHKKLPES